MTRFLLLLFITLNTQAIEVFDENGNYSDEYMLLDFDEGDLPKDGELTLDDGKTYEVVDFLGSGHTTNVIWVEDPITAKEYALRLGKYNDRFIHKTNLIYPILERYNISIPKRYSKLSANYVLQEIADLSFDLDYFFSNFDKEDIIPTIIRDEAAVALMSFAKESAMFSELADFNNTQMAYLPEQKKWILLDWADTYNLFNTLHSPSLFGNFHIFVEADYQKISEEAKVLLENLREITVKERQRLLRKDEISYEKLKGHKSKEGLKKILHHTWYSNKLLEDKILKAYIIDDKMSYVHHGFTTKEMDLIIDRFKLVNDQGKNFFIQHLLVSTSVEEFINTLLKSNYLLSYTKGQVLEDALEHFRELGPNEDHVRLILKVLSTHLPIQTLQKLESLIPSELGSCFSKMREFRR